MKSSTAQLFGIGALVALVLTLLLGIFAWPVVNTAPHRLPVGLVAPAPFAQRLPALLEQVRPRAFDVRSYSSEQDARAAIQKREVYGAFLLNPARAADFKLLTASAGSPAVAQVLTGVGENLGTLLSSVGFSAPRIEDVVATTPDDPRQASLIGIALPLVLGGIVSGLLISRTAASSGARLGGVLLVALLAGFSLAALMQFGFKTLGGEYLLNALVVCLGVGAVASFVVGLLAVLGQRGLGVAGITLMLLSNPFSGLSSAPELLPAGWGTFGQLLPLGAFGHLLRSVAYFDGHGSSGPMWVLIGWVAFGVVLIVVGSRRFRQTPSRTPALAS